MGGLRMQQGQQATYLTHEHQYLITPRKSSTRQLRLQGTVLLRCVGREKAATSGSGRATVIGGGLPGRQVWLELGEMVEVPGIGLERPAEVQTKPAPARKRLRPPRSTSVVQSIRGFISMPAIARVMVLSADAERMSVASKAYIYKGTRLRG
jgi:hypothetical protein